MTSSDPLHRLYGRGVPSYLAEQLIAGALTGAHWWRTIRRDLRQTPDLLALPKGSPLREKLDELVGVKGATFEPQHGVYALSCHEDIDGGVGCVRRLIVHDGEFANTSGAFYHSCDNGIGHGIRACGLDRAKRLHCTVHDIDTSDQSPDKRGGRSAGLAAALAVAHAFERSDHFPRFVAATGAVEPDGRVTPVGHIPQKLEAVLREAPFIERVYLPEGSGADVPESVRERVEICEVGSVEEMLSPLIRRQKTGKKASAARSKPPQDRLEAAWAIPVASCKNPDRSVFVGLIPEPISLPNDCLDEAPPGWRRITDFSKHGYFSALEVETNRVFRELTQDLLAWRPTQDGIELPAVYQFDLERLRNRRRLPGKGAQMFLERIDLLPIQGGRAALLGFWFRGGTCTIKDALAWTSARQFHTLKLETQQGVAQTGLAIGHLVTSLARGVRTVAEPDLFLTGKPRSSGEVKVFQYLLSPEDGPTWSELTDSAEFRLGFELAATVSRPSSTYPKRNVIAHREWDDAPEHQTRYGISPHGVTCWAHAGVQFNRNAKQRVFSEAMYTLWAITRQLAHQGDRTGELQRCLSRAAPPRRIFAENCRDFFENA